MTEQVQGTVYAADRLHRSLNIERADCQGRMIIEPMFWDTDKAYRWVREHQQVTATGLLAAGLPLLMRATVQEVDALRQEE